MKNITIRRLASLIAKAEGKKQQASIGDIREILGILADYSFQDNCVGCIAEMLYDSGRKRAYKKLKKAKNK